MTEEKKGVNFEYTFGEIEEAVKPIKESKLYKRALEAFYAEAKQKELTHSDDVIENVCLGWLLASASANQVMQIHAAHLHNMGYTDEGGVSLEYFLNTLADAKSRIQTKFDDDILTQAASVCGMSKTALIILIAYRGGGDHNIKPEDLH